MLESFSTLTNILLMLLGFGLIIVVHEAGHFFAAKWAGIRVHAFAVGFGKAILSYRRGMGLHTGSTEQDYLGIERAATRLPTDPTSAELESHRIAKDRLARISPTEYRLNWFPFGGYVKMLGQEDLNPDAASQDPDSYTQKPVWKRMIVISGGVIMNVILAAVLFVIAFSVGLMEMAPVIGVVAEDQPAHEAGIRPGDAILAIDDKPVRTFNDLFLATAMAKRDTALTLRIQSPGETGPREVEVTPTPGGGLGLMQIGVGPGVSHELAADFASETDRQSAIRQLADLGLEGVEPGMTLTRAEGPGVVPPGAPGAGEHYSWAQAIAIAAQSNTGAPIDAVFRDDAGSEVKATITPTLETARARVSASDDAPAHVFEHALGLTPVMQVAAVTPIAEEQGLRAGDVFARLGALEWPSVAEGRAEIQRFKRKRIPASVLRDGRLVEFDLAVSRQGQVGFHIQAAPRSVPIVRAIPADAIIDSDDRARRSPAQRLAPAPAAGSRILRVAGDPVDSFADVLQIVRAHATSGARRIPLDVEYRVADQIMHESLDLELTEDDGADLAALSWHVDDLLALFDFQQFELQATDPVNAMVLGVEKTHYVVMITYVTFARLVQGTVPVDQLHGPVGITHVGSQIADRGFVYLIFFLGLISANLAVINFLPLPIVDGGHFVFLLIEGVTKKPVSVAVQNLATVAGLILIGAVFIVVTFNDIMRLVG